MKLINKPYNINEFYYNYKNLLLLFNIFKLIINEIYIILFIKFI